MRSFDVVSALDSMDGVYVCMKSDKSEFLWANRNFLDLVGAESLESMVGTVDPRAAHVEHDKAVMSSGKPLLNFHETIEVPPTNRVGLSPCTLPIVTQKGLLRNGGGAIVGITVCFSFAQPADLCAQRVAELALKPIALGGYFAPQTRSTETLYRHSLPERFVGDRQLYSTNYFLLPQHQVLRLHSLATDEQWFYHEGPPLWIHVFSEGVYTKLELSDQARTAVVPHGSWFGAEVAPGTFQASFTLSSCSLAPGFDVRDSFLPSEEATMDSLFSTFPNQRDILTKLQFKH